MFVCGCVFVCLIECLCACLSVWLISCVCCLFACWCMRLFACDCDWPLVCFMACVCADVLACVFDWLVGWLRVRLAIWLFVVFVDVLVGLFACVGVRSFVWLVGFVCAVCLSVCFSGYVCWCVIV